MLVPTLVVIALVVIPYFNINIEAQGLFLKDRKLRLRIFYIVALALSLFLLVFDVYVALAPTLLVLRDSCCLPHRTRRSLRRFSPLPSSKPLSYWVMTWFLFELVVLTAVGTFFRGPGWSWVWPWRKLSGTRQEPEVSQYGEACSATPFAHLAWSACFY